MSIFSPSCKPWHVYVSKDNSAFAALEWDDPPQYLLVEARVPDRTSISSSDRFKAAREVA